MNSIFTAPNDRAKFRNRPVRFKIATAGAMTDRHTDRQTDTAIL